MQPLLAISKCHYRNAVSGASVIFRIHPLFHAIFEYLRPNWPTSKWKKKSSVVRIDAIQGLKPKVIDVIHGHKVINWSYSWSNKIPWILFMVNNGSYSCIEASGGTHWNHTDQGLPNGPLFIVKTRKCFFLPRIFIHCPSSSKLHALCAWNAHLLQVRAGSPINK